MGDKTGYLLLALLLLTVPGAHSYAITMEVTGRERGSLTLECRYEPGWETYIKWWCRGAAWSSCEILVQTTESEQEVKKGRMSIRDQPNDLKFTMTLEDVRLDDADTYWCGIERTGIDLGVEVHMTVLPEVSCASSDPAMKFTKRLRKPAATRVGAAAIPGPDHSLETKSPLTEVAETTQDGQGA